MATRNPILRYLDRACECHLCNCQKPEPMWIAETKCNSSRQKYQKMLETMCGTG
jgi:hypothetical protein